ncbi:MAG: DUF2846 domain-containing protein [Gammaproteobacteria bacterium]
MLTACSSLRGPLFVDAEYDNFSDRKQARVYFYRNKQDDGFKGVATVFDNGLSQGSVLMGNYMGYKTGPGEHDLQLASTVSDTGIKTNFRVGKTYYFRIDYAAGPETAEGDPTGAFTIVPLSSAEAISEIQYTRNPGAEKLAHNR